MCDGARLRHCARQDEIARLRGEVESEKKLKAVVQAQLTRLLQSAAHDHGGGPGQRADDLEWRAVMMEQLEGASEKARRCEDTIAELSAALAGERERVVQLQADMRMAVIKGEALQEDADAARREKEVAEAQRDEASQHAARMQRLADDALAETGALARRPLAARPRLVHPGRPRLDPALAGPSPRERRVPRGGRGDVPWTTRCVAGSADRGTRAAGQAEARARGWWAEQGTVGRGQGRQGTREGRSGDGDVVLEQPCRGGFGRYRIFRVTGQAPPPAFLIAPGRCGTSSTLDKAT